MASGDDADMNCPKCNQKMHISDQKINIDRATAKTLFRCVNCGFAKRVKRFVTLKQIKDQILVMQ